VARMLINGSLSLTLRSCCTYGFDQEATEAVGYPDDRLPCILRLAPFFEKSYKRLACCLQVFDFWLRPNLSVVIEQKHSGVAEIMVIDEEVWPEHLTTAPCG
jgi:hypothetical protein